METKQMTPKSNPTSGEWKAHLRTYNVIGSSSDERTWQAGIISSEIGMVGLSIGANAQEAEANAKIMASSKKLLESLKELSYLIGSSDINSENARLKFVKAQFLIKEIEK